MSHKPFKKLTKARLARYQFSVASAPQRAELQRRIDYLKWQVDLFTREDAIVRATHQLELAALQAELEEIRRKSRLCRV